MTLGFSTHWPRSKQPTLFPQKIMLPHVAAIRDELPDLIPKIHTFRLGHRWRPGMKIHMVTGNRTPHRHQFNQAIPALQTCVSVQEALISILPTGIAITVGTPDVSQRWLTRPELLLFAANDGFNSIEEMERWFYPRGYTPVNKVYTGQIVHWTDFQYSTAPPARDDWYADPGQSGYVDF